MGGRRQDEISRQLGKFADAAGRFPLNRRQLRFVGSVNQHFRRHAKTGGVIRVWRVCGLFLNGGNYGFDFFGFHI